MKFRVLWVPGHGAKDGGGHHLDTEGSKLILKESKINLNVALEAHQEAVALGWESYVSRTLDTQYVTPADQLKLILRIKPHVAVAIHHNDAVAESAKGCEVLYHHTYPESRALAILMQKHLLELGQEDRGIKAVSNIAVLKARYVPTVLSEYAFLTTADYRDVNKLYQQQEQAHKMIECLQEWKALKRL